MTRAQRRLHARLWIVLALALIAVFTLSLAARERVSDAAHAAAQS